MYMRKKLRTKTTISILFTLLKKLKEYSEATHIPMSAIIEMALKDFFENKNKKV